MGFQGSYFISYIFKILTHLNITISYTLFALFYGIIAGLVLALFKISNSRILKWIADILTAIFRSIPPVVLLFLVYYGLPFLSETLFSIDLGKKESLYFVKVAVTIIGAVQFSEIFRSAITSVEKGQKEAAYSIGLTRFQTFRRIVFPQMMSYALPSMSSVVISITKEGSLGYTIGLMDIFGWAKNLNTISYNSYMLEIYVALIVCYWMIMLVIVLFFKLLESHYNRRFAVQR